jgi:MoaA/NifB/PqqE/SkfB family radical SAM enzyme
MSFIPTDRQEDTETHKPDDDRVTIDAEGRLVLPRRLRDRYGLTAGARLHLDLERNGLYLRRPTSQPARVYIEATNACNLSCRTCVRNRWDEPTGFISGSTFQRIIDGIGAFSSAPEIFFGGLGEPLTHPDIVAMVTAARAVSPKVSVITNAMLLTPELARELIAAGLDTLWVSLDGADGDSYADVRTGAAWGQVLDNVTAFRDARGTREPPHPELGIAFVAMRSNLDQLPRLLGLGRHLGAARFMVTNVLAYTEEMCPERLYTPAVTTKRDLPTTPDFPLVTLPAMDLNATTRDVLYRVLRTAPNLALGDRSLGHHRSRCPFVESGATAIAWTGDVSPCIPLMHDHSSYLENRERVSRAFAVGNVNEVGLSALWHQADYAELRDRVQSFDFSPCTLCGGCDLSADNETDCFGSPFPTCGGCLWAQGVVQCP